LRTPAALVCLVLLSAARAAGTPTLRVDDAWVRATPGVDVAAVYLTLHNTGAEAVVITGVRSSVAGHAMIHETAVHDGVSTMRPHEPLTLAPGATVRFAPGGLHIMLSALAHPLATGERVPLELLLAGGGTLALEAPVRPLT
jgi:periplasmic copper chaperone A